MNVDCTGFSVSCLHCDTSFYNTDFLCSMSASCIPYQYSPSVKECDDCNRDWPLLAGFELSGPGCGSKWLDGIRKEIYKSHFSTTKETFITITYYYPGNLFRAFGFPLKQHKLKNLRTTFSSFSHICRNFNFKRVMTYLIFQRPLFRHYYKGTDAVVMVVDSSDRERLEELYCDVLKPALHAEELAGSIFLFLVNKRDLPDTMNKEEVTVKLNLQSVKHTWSKY